MRPLNTGKFRKQDGQVIIIVALLLMALIASVGLAVDSGFGYMIKAKLNAATDAAGIAAAVAVTQGSTRAAQTSNAQLAAANFFYVNYPVTGYLGSTPTFLAPTITFSTDKPGQIIIDTPASASVPVTFMRAMGFNLLTVAAASQTIRNDLDLAFVVDTTGSMNTGTVPTKVKQGAITFINKFSPNDDRVALIQFAYGAQVRDQIRPTQRGFDLTSMTTHINAFTFDGSTNSAEGMWNARDQLNNKITGNRSSLRVIVFLSDGAPNSFSSFFDFRNASDCTQSDHVTPLAGTISTPDTQGPYNPGFHWTDGLRDPYKVDADPDNGDAPLGGTSTKCWQDNDIANTAGVPLSHSSYITKLPNWYNAHNDPANPNDSSKREFQIVTNTPRAVTNNTSSPAMAWQNVNRASRNLLEAMATKSRQEGIFIFTLGLDGTGLSTPSGPDSETGDQVLKCMANTADALPRCVSAGAGQPVGIYCHAVTADDLKPCFEKLASAILRISK